MKRRDLYVLAIGKYGTQNQQLMVIEEMSELTKVILKGFRDETNHDDLIDEIADVEIMIEQLKLMHNVNDDVSKRKKYKKKRLEKRLWKKEH